MKTGGIFYVVTSRQARDFATAYFCLLKMEEAIPRKNWRVGKLSFEKVWFEIVLSNGYLIASKVFLKKKKIASNVRQTLVRWILSFCDSRSCKNSKMITWNSTTTQPRFVVFDICIATWKNNRRHLTEKPRTMWCRMKGEKQVVFIDRIREGRWRYW